MESFGSDQGRTIILDLVRTIQDNADYLSEIDGAIGDGDHGINMNKGFSRVQERLDDQVDLASCLKVLGEILLSEIGGAMGPLYGTFFLEMAGACKSKTEIDSQVFGQMLDAALKGVQDIGNARVGDKTLIDTLVPAHQAFFAAIETGEGFAGALRNMVGAAEKGKESTRDLVAKIGRASRLGDRSRGYLDAGSTSCYLILKSLADTITALL